MPYGVGVVADTYPAALKAKKALKVEWTQRSKARAYTSEKLIPEYLQRARNLADKGTVYEAHGDAREAMAKAAKRVTAEYTSLNVTHACMEPINCTARVDGERSEEHTSELQSLAYLVCRLLLEKKTGSLLPNNGADQLRRPDSENGATA